MSSPPPKNCVYIPSHLIQYFLVNPATLSIDTSHILAATTADELLQIIKSVKPRIHVPAPDNQNHEFLKKLFTEMAANEIVNLHIPHPDGEKFIRATLRIHDTLPEDSLTIYKATDKIDGTRHNRFKIYVLSKLRAGSFLELSDSISDFLDDYKYLTNDEIDEIRTAIEEVEDRSTDCKTRLQDTHKIVQASKLALRQSDLERNERKKITARLDGAYAVLKQREEALTLSLKNAAYLEALVEHHE